MNKKKGAQAQSNPKPKTEKGKKNNNMKLNNKKDGKKTK